MKYMIKVKKIFIKTIKMNKSYIQLNSTKINKFHTTYSTETNKLKIYLQIYKPKTKLKLNFEYLSTIIKYNNNILELLYI